MAKKIAGIMVYESGEVCKLYNTKIYEELHQAALSVTKEYGRERGIKISEILSAWNEGFSKDYDAYLASVRARKKKQADKQVTEMRKKQDRLSLDILGVEGGYVVAEVIEKKGLKVDWQKTPVNVINRVSDIKFLAKKGYDFNQRQDFNGKKISFTDYHCAFLAHYEELVVKDYNYLMKLLEYRNKLIAKYKKDSAEFKNPKTPEARKKQLEKDMAAENKAYQKIRDAIPSTYEKVNNLMDNYFKHGVCLDYAVRNNLLSAENVKKVDMETFTESMRNMFARDTRMKQIKTLIDKGQVNNKTDTKSDTLAMAEELNMKTKGLSQALAISENAPASYENQTIANKEVLGAVYDNGVTPDNNLSENNFSSQNGNMSQLAQAGTIVVKTEDEKTVQTVLNAGRVS